MDKTNKWDQKKYIKEGGDEYSNKYDANKPYYGDVKHEMKDGTTGENKPTDFWAKTKHPTQEEIIAHNRKEYSASIDGPGEPIDRTDKETVIVEKEFLEKLKDFNYWKEWKNQGD